MCNEKYHCNDICMASCGHMYHPWCLAIHCTSSLTCKVKGCEQKFESDWRLSSGFSNKAQDDVNSPMQLGPTLFTRVSSNYTNFASFIAILAHILWWICCYGHFFVVYECEHCLFELSYNWSNQFDARKWQHCYKVVVGPKQHWIKFLIIQLNSCQI